MEKHKLGVTVRQKRPGKGNAWYIYIHQNQNIVSRKIGTKREAEAAANMIRKKMVAGDLSLGNTAATTLPNIIAYAQKFIDNYAKVACKENTWRGYQIILDKHLKPYWQGKRLDQVTRADVKKLLLAKQREGFAPSTVENIKAFISGLFTHAYEDELLDKNPALKLGRFIQKQDHRRNITPLTPDQVRTFLTAAQEHYPDQYPLLLCAFRTGMRLGEVLGLSWDTIDFVGNRIEVRRTYSHSHFDTPKSHKSRTIDMSNQLRTALLAHRSRLTQQFDGHLPYCEAPTPRGNIEHIQLVFPSDTGGPTDGDNFRKRVFYKLLELADMPRFRFHDIRHTFASLLLQNAESLHYVKEQMGHASIQTTVDVYGHLVPGSNRNAVNRLDDPTEPALTLVGDSVG